MREVSTQAFASARADGVVTIDVREPGEYLAGHVPGVRLLPTSEVGTRLDELPRSAPLYVICANGNRTRGARLFMSDGRPSAQVSGTRARSDQADVRTAMMSR